MGLFDLLWDDGAVILDDSITSDYVNNFATSLNAFLGAYEVLVLFNFLSVFLSNLIM